MTEPTAVVTGAGGFIGHHLVSYLKDLGYYVRGVDIKKPEFEPTRADEFLLADLRDPANCDRATADVDRVYALAADMGGMGFISTNHSRILRNNLLVNLNTLESAARNGVDRYFFSSSACVYPEYRQTEAEVTALKEEDAYPAMPQDAYGWEKLVTERLCGHYLEDRGIKTRVARFHNIFGPLGSWEGGREKVPAAICRKVAVAKATGSSEIEIWGDGLQTRSFCFVDDCVRGVQLLADSEVEEPLNLGQDQLISINDLALTVARIAGIDVQLKHVPGPEGVRGRNSDNTRVEGAIAWSPEVPLEDGLRRTYSWIEQQVMDRAAAGESIESAAVSRVWTDEGALEVEVSAAE
jgi:nucleoside-diphosphate-sugar epimerase